MVAVQQISPTQQRHSYVAERLRLQSEFERNRRPRAVHAYPALSSDPDDDDIVGARQPQRLNLSLTPPMASRIQHASAAPLSGMSTSAGERWSTQLQASMVRDPPQPAGRFAARADDSFAAADELSDEEEEEEPAPASATLADDESQPQSSLLHAGEALLAGHAAQLRALTAEQHALETELARRREEVAGLQASAEHSDRRHGAELLALRQQLEAERTARQAAETDAAAARSSVETAARDLVTARAALSEARAATTEAEAGRRSAEDRAAAAAAAEQRVQAQIAVLVNEVSEARQEGEASARRAQQRAQQEADRDLAELKRDLEARLLAAERRARESEAAQQELEAESKQVKDAAERERRTADERQQALSQRLSAAEEQVRQLAPCADMLADQQRRFQQELADCRSRSSAETSAALDVQKELRAEIEAAAASARRQVEEVEEARQRDVKRAKDRAKQAMVKELKRREGLAKEALAQREKELLTVQKEQSAQLAARSRETSELAAQFSAARLHVQQLETEIGCVRDNVASARATAEDAERRAEQAQTRARDLDEQLREQRRELDRRRAETDSVRRQLERQLDDERQRRTKAAEDAAQSSADAEKLKGMLEDERSSAMAEAQRLRRRVQAGESQVEDERRRCEERVTEAEQRCAALEAAVAEAEDRAARAATQLRAADDATAAARQDRDRLQHQYRAVRDRITAASASAAPHPSAPAVDESACSDLSSSLSSVPRADIGADEPQQEEGPPEVAPDINARLGECRGEMKRLLRAMSANEAGISVMRNVLSEAPTAAPVPRRPSPGGARKSGRSSSLDRKRK